MQNLKYEVIINQIIGRTHYDEVVGILETTPELFDKGLLNEIVLLKENASDISLTYLEWLIKILNLAFEKKCLKTFMTIVDYGVSLKYFNEYINEIITNSNYELLEQGPGQYGLTELEFEKSRNTLIRLAVSTYVDVGWMTSRELLMNGLRWLVNGNAEIIFRDLEIQYDNSGYFRTREQAVKRCLTEDVRKVIVELDIAWLLHLANASSGRDKLPYIYNAIELAADQPSLYASLKNMLGQTLFELPGPNKAENIEYAIIAFNDALSISSLEQHSTQWAFNQNCLGVAYLDRVNGNKTKNLEQAINSFYLALKVYSYDRFPKEWALTQKNLGDAYASQTWQESGNLEKAISIYQKILKFCTIQKDAENYAATHAQLGIVFFKRIFGDKAENIEKAIYSYTEALRFCTDEQSVVNKGRIQNNLGIAYRERIHKKRLENIELAIQLHNDTLAIFNREEFPEDYANTQVNLCTAYRIRIQGERSENIELAIHACSEALTVYTKGSSPLQWSFAQTAMGTVLTDRVFGQRANNIEMAIVCYLEALSVENPPEHWARIQNNLGVAYDNRVSGQTIKNSEFALKAYQEALKVYTPERFPNSYIDLEINIAIIYYKQRNWHQALGHLKNAVASTESLRSQLESMESGTKMSNHNLLVYRLAVHCSLEIGNFEEALVYSINSKGRTIVERLAGDKQTLSYVLEANPEMKTWHLPLEKLTLELNEYEYQRRALEENAEDLSSKIHEESIKRITEKITKTKNDINVYVEELVFRFPALASVYYFPPVELATIWDIYNKLGDIPMIEYVRHYGGWGAFIIRDQSINYVALQNDLREELIKSKALDFLYSPPQGDEYLQQLRKIYYWVFEAIKPYLGGAQNIVISPTGLLHLIPFQTLIDSDGTYLSEIFAMTFIPSIAAIPVLLKNRTSKAMPIFNRVLNVAYPGDNENYLFSVMKEAEAVAKNFSESVPLYNEDANPDSVIKHSNESVYSVIHFNCHGHFDVDNPQFSGLSLSRQVLTIMDIELKMRLQGNPLVTLSACQTGVLMPDLVDESNGVAGAFLFAGASATISSLWSVPAEATKQLMSYFYSIRKDSVLTEAEVLQQAMMKMKDKNEYRKKPYFWSAFQVIGLPIRPQDNELKQ